MMAGMANTGAAADRPRHGDGADHAGHADNTVGTDGADGAVQFCDQCGKPAAEGDAHGTCAARRELEPPRYCPQCARRMVVQIVPTGWTARCSVHGELRSTAAAAS